MERHRSGVLIAIPRHGGVRRFGREVRVTAKAYISPPRYLYAERLLGSPMMPAVRHRAIGDSAEYREETILPTRSSENRSNETRARAEASFSREERAKDGAKAMMEYVAHGKMLRERTARLKALRLEKEAADRQLELAAKPPAGARRRKTP
jgi:hypothetical protein